MILPDARLVYPAHDCDGRCVSTTAEEKAFSTRIGGAASREGFVGYMKNLGLPHPKKTAIALPANMRSGMPENGLCPEAASWGPVEETCDGILQISADRAESHPDRVTVLGVREPGERAADPLSIRDALAIPLGQLASRINDILRSRPIVTVCRSERRSAQAIVILKRAGATDAANLKNNMIEWARAHARS